MSKQSKLKLIPVAAVLLAVLTVYTIVFGNPLFKYFASNTADRYITENYPDCYIEEIVYDGIGIFSGYRAVIKSKSDASFEKTIYMDITGIAVNKKAMHFFYSD